MTRQMPTSMARKLTVVKRGAHVFEVVSISMRGEGEGVTIGTLCVALPINGDF